MRKFYEELVRQMEQDMRRSEDMVRRFLQVAGPADKYWEPPVDVYETVDALHVKIELAGVHPDHLQVELTADGRAVIIRGERRDGTCEGVGVPPPERRTTFHQMEIYFGPFERVIPLPVRVEVDREHVQASYRDGFLTVSLPKVHATARPTTTNVPVTG
jgi:HSP20 family protein